MGFRYRKSINLGCAFRINLSKSGVGYSWGVPGYRVTKPSRGGTRKTYSLPGTGISYVESSGGTKRRTQAPHNESAEAIRDIESAEIERFQATEHTELIEMYGKLVRLNTISNILLCFIIIPPLFILPIAGAVLKVLLRTKYRLDLTYSFEDDMEEDYNRKVAAWLILNESPKTWQITQEASVSNRKANVGAGRKVNRALIRLSRKSPWYIHTNVPPVVLPLKMETILILPDRMLIVRKKQMGALDYDKLNISIGQTRFIEEECIPKGAIIVDQRWQYVNKNGAPDKRYKNNRLLPVCLYGNIKLTSPQGLNVEIQTSSVDVAQRLGEALKAALL